MDDDFACRPAGGGGAGPGAGPGPQGFLHGAGCPCCLKPAPAQVDLDEMEFERGVGGAALANDVDRLRRLLAKGRDPDEAAGGAGLTPLMYAARKVRDAQRAGCTARPQPVGRLTDAGAPKGHLEACRVLVEYGADPARRTAGGATCLHRAAYMGHRDIVELLLRHGAEAGARDSDGKSAWDKANERGHGGLRDLLAGG